MRCSSYSYGIIAWLAFTGAWLTVFAQDQEIAIATGGVNVEEAPADKLGNILARAYVPDETREVIAGDVLRFQVFEDEEAPQFIQINDQGYADFPYLGRKAIEGMTCKGIADMLKVELEERYYYKATVFIAVERENPIRGRVEIVGEVGHQGPLGIPADTEFTLSKAVLAAGGFTQYAKENKVKLIRKNPDGSQSVQEIDVEYIFKTGDRSADPVLRPNDYIIVPKSSINF